MFQLIKEEHVEHELQAIFIQYDYYYDYKGVVTGYGKQHYPVVVQPRYLNNEIDYSNVVLEAGEAVDFEKAWVDCEEMEWTTKHIEVNYQLELLYQLHSRLLLHDAIKNCYDKGQLNFLPRKPFTFYVGEHDCEVMTLFRVD